MKLRSMLWSNEVQDKLAAADIHTVEQLTWHLTSNTLNPIMRRIGWSEFHCTTLQVICRGIDEGFNTQTLCLRICQQISNGRLVKWIQSMPAFPIGRGRLHHLLLYAMCICLLMTEVYIFAQQPSTVEEVFLNLSMGQSIKLIELHQDQKLHSSYSKYHVSSLQPGTSQLIKYYQQTQLSWSNTNNNKLEMGYSFNSLDTNCQLMSMGAINFIFPDPFLKRAWCFKKLKDFKFHGWHVWNLRRGHFYKKLKKLVFLGGTSGMIFLHVLSYFYMSHKVYQVIVYVVQFLQWLLQWNYCRVQTTVMQLSTCYSLYTLFLSCSFWLFQTSTEYIHGNFYAVTGKNTSVVGTTGHFCWDCKGKFIYTRTHQIVILIFVKSLILNLPEWLGAIKLVGGVYLSVTFGNINKLLN